MLEKEDDRYLYVKDLCSEDKGEFKITKKSLNLSAIRSREVGKSTLICELIYFGNACRTAKIGRASCRERVC